MVMVDPSHVSLAHSALPLESSANSGSVLQLSEY